MVSENVTFMAQTKEKKKCTYAAIIYFKCIVNNRINNITTYIYMCVLYVCEKCYLFLYTPYSKGWAFMITSRKYQIGISHFRMECIKQSNSWKTTQESVLCEWSLYSACPKVPGPIGGAITSISLMSFCLQSCARGRCAVEWGPETLWGLPSLPSISPLAALTGWMCR